MKQYFEETGAGKAFFELLRAGLWGHVPEQAFFMDLKPDDWRQILGMAQKQAVLGLIYAGVSRLPKPLMPKQQTVLRLYGLAEQIRRKNREIAAITREICGWFEEAGLEPIVLKGQSVGAFYADPELRQSGDLDLFFHRDYERVVPIVQVRGISVELDTHHDTFVYQGIVVELHREPCDLVRKSRVHYEPAFQNWGEEGMRVLEPTGNAFLILMHAALHFMASGLGLRQFCDWAVLLQHVVRQKEWNEVIKLMEEQGAGCFAREFTVLAVEILGVNGPWQVEVLHKSRKNLRQVLLHELIRQGNFGHQDVPQKGEVRKWFIYTTKKFLMTCRVYPFYPDYIWIRSRKRIGFLFRRLFCRKKIGLNSMLSF